jgi:hypothetical protein
MYLCSNWGEDERGAGYRGDAAGAAEPSAAGKHALKALADENGPHESSRWIEAEASRHASTGTSQRGEHPQLLGVGDC